MNIKHARMSRLRFLEGGESPGAAPGGAQVQVQAPAPHPVQVTYEAKPSTGEQESGPAGVNNGEHGFPENTPIDRMTAEQQAAYWKHQSRKHENTWKQVIDKNLTPEQVLEMQEKLDDANRERMTAHQREVDDAKKAAAVETRAEIVPQLVQAKLEAAIARRDPSLDGDAVTAKVEFLDLSRFLTKSGEVDADKVSTWAEANVAAVERGEAEAKQKFPDTGGGKRGPVTESAKARATQIARERGYIRD